jgi:hypothetical protein
VTSLRIRRDVDPSYTGIPKYFFRMGTFQHARVIESARAFDTARR